MELHKGMKVILKDLTEDEINKICEEVEHDIERDDLYDDYIDAKTMLSNHNKKYFVVDTIDENDWLDIHVNIEGETMWLCSKLCEKYKLKKKSTSLFNTFNV